MHFPIVTIRGSRYHIQLQSQYSPLLLASYTPILRLVRFVSDIDLDEALTRLKKDMPASAPISVPPRPMFPYILYSLQGHRIIVGPHTGLSGVNKTEKVYGSDGTSSIT